jgi:hypothetical protein
VTLSVTGLARETEFRRVHSQTEFGNEACGSVA